MQKLTVGIIGVGMAFERLHYPAFQKLQDKYEIRALCDVDPEKTIKWANNLNLSQENTYTDWEEMLKRDDLDVIDIMVPIELNKKITQGVAKRASNRRIGIICEKPLASTPEEALAARDLAKKYGVPIMIAENYRYNEEYNIIRDLVRTRHVGDVVYFMQNRFDDFPAKMKKDTFQAKEWRQHPEYQGGDLIDTALHDIAALRHIFGPLDKLQAFGSRQEADYSPYAVINVNLRFKTGITGQFSFFSSGKEMQRPLIGLRIFGTEGMIFLEEKTAGTINVAYNDGRAEQIPYKPEAGYYNELLNFYNALTGNEPISVTPETEFGDFRTIQDIMRSIREETIISVNDNYFHPEHEEQAPLDLHPLH